MLKSERVALHQRVQLRVFQCVQMEKVTPKCVRFSRLSIKDQVVFILLCT